MQILFCEGDIYFKLKGNKDNAHSDVNLHAQIAEVIVY